MRCVAERRARKAWTGKRMLSPCPNEAILMHFLHLSLSAYQLFAYAKAVTRTIRGQREWRYCASDLQHLEGKEGSAQTMSTVLNCSSFTSHGAPDLVPAIHQNQCDTKNPSTPSPRITSRRLPIDLAKNLVENLNWRKFRRVKTQNSM